MRRFTTLIPLVRVPFALALLAMAGCTGAVPFVPDRVLVRSIPRDIAKGELRRLLELARPFNPAVTMDWENPPLAVFEVADDFFAVSGTIPGGGPVERTFYYEELDLRCFRDPVFRGTVFIALDDGFTGGTPGQASIASGCIWFEEEDDAEKCLEALSSLQAEVIAGAPVESGAGGAASADPDAAGHLLECEVCGHDVSSRATVCPNCGDPRD